LAENQACTKLEHDMESYMRAFVAPLVLAALTACNVDQQDGAALLPADQLAPSSTLVLTMDALIPGEPVTITVTGAQPNDSVLVIRSTAGEGLDAGLCPTGNPVDLGGNCMDILGPYTLTLSGRADASGTATWSLPAFPNLPPVDIWFQAVVADGVDSNKSNALYNPVLAPCATDAFEPNDDLASAPMLPIGITPGLTSCEGDDDFFMTPAVPDGEVVTATAFFSDDGEGDLDLEMLTGPATVVDASFTTTDDEEVQFLNTSGAAAPVGIRAYTFADVVAPGVVGIPYDLAIDIAAPAPCVDDALEDNDDAASAFTAPVGTPWSAVSCDDGAGGSDDDWYNIACAAGDILDVTVDLADGDGDVNIYLYDDQGNLLDDALFGDPLTVGAACDGTDRVLQVEFEADDFGGGGVAYDATATTTTPAPCFTDPAEPDNDAATGTIVADGDSITATGCLTDSDFYCIDVVAGDDVTFTLSHDTQGGDQDVDMNLFDSAGNLADSIDFNFTSPETVNATATGPDTWCAEVTTQADDAAGGGVPYTLDVAVLVTTPCTPDAFEPNDDIATATPLTLGSYTGLSTCAEIGSAGAGGDYYAVDLLAGDIFTADVLFVDDEGDIDLQILDTAGGTLSSSGSTSDNESATYTAAADETVYVRVWLWSDAGANGGNTYDLNLTVAP
jgi:hypothetical protein